MHTQFSPHVQLYANKFQNLANLLENVHFQS